MKTPRLPTEPSSSEPLPPHPTHPRTPVLAIPSPATRQKGKVVVEVPSDSDDNRHTSKATLAHKFDHRSKLFSFI